MKDKIIVVGLCTLYLVPIVMFVSYIFDLKELTKRKVNGNELSKIHRFVRNVNAGGCGYFALKLYERLDSSRYDIVVIDSFAHVAIRDRETGSFIDATGFRDSLSFQLRYKNKFDIITVDSLRNEVYRVQNWNRDFNRNDTDIINMFIENL